MSNNLFFWQSLRLVKDFQDEGENTEKWHETATLLQFYTKKINDYGSELHQKYIYYKYRTVLT